MLREHQKPVIPATPKIMTYSEHPTAIGAFRRLSEIGVR